MKMTSALDALKSLETEWRMYSSNGWYQHVLLPQFSELLASMPDKKLADCFEELGWMQRRTRDLVQVRSLVAWGSEDLGLVERAFDIQLPPWAHEFYRHVRCAVLCFRNPIHILTPQQMIEQETLLREAAHSPGLPEIPVRIVSFADAGIEGCAFAFRQNTQTQQWEIAFVSLDDSREEFQKAQFESWCARYPDIDHWLDRMIQTDGFPLQAGREKTEICYTEHEHNPKYTRQAPIAVRRQRGEA